MGRQKRFRVELRGIWRFWQGLEFQLGFAKRSSATAPNRPS